MFSKNIFRKWLSVFATLACTSVVAIPPPPPAPELQDLANARCRGLIDVEGAIKLSDGHWQGEPWLEGGVVAPSAQLLGTLVVQGDLDSDGRTESVNLVNYSTGGTGQLLHLAVSRFDEEGVDNFATVFVGDRVMVRALRLEGVRIVADLVQAGPNDGAFCPGAVITRAWRLQDGQLREEPADAEPQRLSVDILTGTQWVLSGWGFDEVVENGVTITLEYSDGAFTGRSACNRYFAGVSEDGDIAGGISVASVGGTRMACVEDHLAKADERYFKALERVNRVSFMAGELMLPWGEGSEFGALYFRRVEP